MNGYVFFTGCKKIRNLRIHVAHLSNHSIVYNHVNYITHSDLLYRKMVAINALRSAPARTFAIFHDVHYDVFGVRKYYVHGGSQ